MRFRPGPIVVAIVIGAAILGVSLILIGEWLMATLKW